MSDQDQMNDFPNPRKEILEMQAYSAPLENRRSLLRLDFNENTLGPSPKVLQAIKSIELNEISIYPEYKVLKDIVSKKYSTKYISIKEIGLFNGADAAINAIFNSFGIENEIFLTTTPTFGYYTPCAEVRGMKIITCPYQGREFIFPTNNFKERRIIIPLYLNFIYYINYERRICFKIYGIRWAYYSLSNLGFI